ncbi:polymorphic toxin-type HINT domain-containing protein [Cysteiniphilum litorale]|uniref:polymorphic toxin-type HINT domain-containing protein n=1 Tax=Cysteiniphilum litorale TaxID=2056700 RepID=UPI003F884FF8
MSFAASAQVTNYDLMSITPKTWQQVTLNYTDQIDGQPYPAEIKLLRPIKWLEENGIDQVGKRSTFSLPEFGIDQVEVTVTDITDTKVDTKADDWRKEKTKTVISTFKRYAQDVRTYTFIDEKGNIEQINATPNHPFYVVNQQAYIAIDEVAANDVLISQLGKKIRLLCPIGKVVRCGEQFNNDGKPVLVYNLEVYQQHIYYVGRDAVLVHNNCQEYFVGYHGTSERSARNIINTGIREEALPNTGQIGKGFYVGKTREIAEWGAVSSTLGASKKMAYWKKGISYIFGEKNNPFINIDERQTILEIYSSKPLSHTSWNKMNPPDLSVIQEVGYNLSDDAKWLQMVIKPNEFKYLSARRLTDNTIKRVNFWYPHEW